MKYNQRVLFTLLPNKERARYLSRPFFMMTE
jgi:hypothetical protein